MDNTYLTVERWYEKVNNRHGNTNKMSNIINSLSLLNTFKIFKL